MSSRWAKSFRFAHPDLTDEDIFEENPGHKERMTVLKNFLKEETRHRDGPEQAKRLIKVLQVAPFLELRTPRPDIVDLKTLWRLKLRCFKEMIRLLKETSSLSGVLAVELGGVVVLLGAVIFQTSELRRNLLVDLNMVQKKRAEDRTLGADGGGVTAPFHLREELREKVQEMREYLDRRRGEDPGTAAAEHNVPLALLDALLSRIEISSEAMQVRAHVISFEILKHILA